MNEERLNAYFPIIQKHYPTAKREDVVILCCGFAHTVLKIHGEVFRFPKTKESEHNMHVESVFSKRFSPVSPIPVPVITNHHDPTSEIIYQTYEFISGVPFTQDFASHVSENELTSIAELLGKFLTKLHTFPREEAKSFSMTTFNTPEEFAKYYLRLITEDKKLIRSVLTSNEWKWIEGNTQAYHTLCSMYPFALSVTHADLLPKHILIDEKTHRLTGIIDFSLKIADPTVDFRYFDRYGELFLKTVYAHYLDRDPHFDERRKFHVGDFFVGKIYLTTQEKDWAEQKKYTKELRKYIATHPLK